MPLMQLNFVWKELTAFRQKNKTITFSFFAFMILQNKFSLIWALGRGKSKKLFKVLQYVSIEVLKTVRVTLIYIRLNWIYTILWLYTKEDANKL